jgi:hypothetical protein
MFLPQGQMGGTFGLGLDAGWTGKNETRVNIDVYAGLVIESGSAGKTRTYNPPVTLVPTFSRGGGLSHQLPRRKVAGRFRGLIGFGSSTPSLCTFLTTVRFNLRLPFVRLRSGLPCRLDAGVGFPARRPFLILATLQESLSLPL